MARTEYFRAASGSVLYAKPLPLQTVDWGADVIAGAENGTTGSFAFAGLDDNTDYEVFDQAGGQPAATDTAIGMLPAESLPAQLSGPHSVTISVLDDQSNPVADAKVRLFRSGESETRLTDMAGQVAFAAGTGTWQVAISAQGHQNLLASVSVAGDLSQAFTLLPIAVSTPAGPELCVVQAFVYHNGDPVSGAVVKARLRDTNSAVPDAVLSTLCLEATTDANGYAELQLVRQSAFIAGTGTYVIDVWHNGRLITHTEAAIPDQSTITIDDLLAIQTM